MEKSCSTDIYGSRKECHSKGFLMGDSLESSNEVCSFKVLVYISYAPIIIHLPRCIGDVCLRTEGRKENKPSIHESIDHEVHP